MIPGIRRLSRLRQVVRFEKRRKYLPVGSTPASLPARLSNRTTCFLDRCVTCLNDVDLAMTRSLLILFTCAGLLLACMPREMPLGKQAPGKTAVSEAATVLQVGDIDALKRLLEKGPRPVTVRLEPGTYRTLSPLRIVGIHGLRLEARGARLILESPDYNVIEIRDSSQVSIIGIHARHAKPSGPAGCLGTVIQIENSQSVEIAESELDGSGTVGIAAYDAPDLLIRDNHIHHNSAYPVVYQGPSVTLRGNLFQANGNGNRIAFSRTAEKWPPAHNIGEDTRLPGLRMEGNRFLPPR